MICQGCNEKIRWWQARHLSSRLGWLHTRMRCITYAEQRDVSN